MRTQCFFLCGVAVLCVPAFAFAAVNETIQSRQELLRQQAEQTFPEINQTLEVILRKVNLNQRPEQQRVQEAAEMLEANRRFVPFYESPQKAVYMLLQSWTSYYQEDPAGYLNWAVRACREDASNGDAWITQAVFSCIHGRAPLESRKQLPERSARVPLRGGRRGDLTDNSLVAQGSGSSPFGQQGILEFDLTKLRRDFLREKFSRQEYQTVDGRKVSYLPSSEDILCLFFWEIEETQADLNLPGRGPRTPDRPQLAETTFGNGQSQHSLEAQQGYFELMSEVLSEKKEVKFVEINTNREPIIIAKGIISFTLKAIICAVIVVPMFAPIITPTACDRFIIPAFTRPTTITVVAPLLLIIAVIIAPIITPRILFVVSISRSLFILFPADF